MSGARWVRGPAGVRHIIVGDAPYTLGTVVTFLCRTSWRVTSPLQGQKIRGDCQGCDELYETAACEEPDELAVPA